MKSFICACLLVLCVSVGSLHAQTTNGSIQGTVSDPNGGTVAGASVTARNLDTGLTQATSTTDAGIYSLPNLPPGRYSVVVEAPGLKKHSQEGVTVLTGTTVSLDIPMQVGGVSENITVIADASQLQTATSEIGSTVEPVLVANLPLQVSGTIRNPVQFIELVPGFVGGVANNPGSNSSDDFKVNGGQEGGTDILVDGVSISLVSPNTQWNKGVSTDAIEEFRVLQSNFSAEYGQSGDGIVSLTVKSGTNQLHGSAYDFLRNAGLDANSWKNNLEGAKRIVDTQNDFGATIGGPVWIPKVYNGKNKTFFFFAYEGFRFKTGGNGTITLPNEDFRKGDFSGICNAGFTSGICNNLNNQLYDPTTHAAIPGDVLTNARSVDNYGRGDNRALSPELAWPAITVPMGYTRGNTLPAGMTIFGRAFDESRLIKLAYAYEQATNWRRQPASTPPLK